MNPANVAQILIADDDPVTRLILGKILTSVPGYKITEASDGEAAWRLLEDGGFVPDVCISDLMMPRCGGLDLLRRIRGSARLKKVRVILCSAVAEKARVEEAAALAPDFYLLKPFKRDLLLERVRQALSRGQEGIRWEDSALACQRLGIDEETYRHSVQLLLEQIRQTTPVLKETLTHGEVGSAGVLLSAVKGAAATLGASPVASLISKAEEALHSLRSPASGAPEHHHEAALAAWRLAIEPPLQATIRALEDEVARMTPANGVPTLANMVTMPG